MRSFLPYGSSTDPCATPLAEHVCIFAGSVQLTRACLCVCSWQGTRASNDCGKMMAPPGNQKQSPMKLLYMLPLLFLSNKIEYTDNLVYYLRISYYIVQFATLAVAWFLKQKVSARVGVRAAEQLLTSSCRPSGVSQIEAKKDNTKIYLPAVKAAFAPPPENPVSQTGRLFVHVQALIEDVIDKGRTNCLSAKSPPAYAFQSPHR